MSFQEFADVASPHLLQTIALTLRVAMTTSPSSLSGPPESANAFTNAFREVLKKRIEEAAETAKALKCQQVNEREEAIMRIGNERAKRRKSKDDPTCIRVARALAFADVGTRMWYSMYFKMIMLDGLSESKTFQGADVGVRGGPLSKA